MLENSRQKTFNWHKWYIFNGKARYSCRNWPQNFI